MPRASSASRSLGRASSSTSGNSAPRSRTRDPPRRPFREGETVGAISCSSPSVALRWSRASASRRPGSRSIPGRAWRRTRTSGRPCRTSMPPATSPGTGSSRTAFREGEIAAENATGHEAPMPEAAVPRPIYTDPEIAGVGVAEAEARERHGNENIAVGRFPWVANARAVMSGEAGGWVKTIHETTYGNHRCGHRRRARDGSHRSRCGCTRRRVDDRDDRRWDGSASHSTVKASRSRDRSPSVERSIFRRDGSRTPPGPGRRSFRYPPEVSIYNKRNAAVGYITLKAASRALERRRQRRNGLKLGLYIGLGLVSVGILAAVAVIAVRRQDGAAADEAEEDLRRPTRSARTRARSSAST